MWMLKRLSMDANQLADVLKISPLYKQRENARWNSALEIYQRNLSTTEFEQMSMSEMNQESALNKTCPNMNTSTPTAIPQPLLRGRSGMLSPTFFPLHPMSLPPSRGGGLSGMSSPRGLGFILGGTSLRGSNTSPGEDSHNSLELEAVAAVHELSFAVEGIAVSDMLPRTPDLIFVNLTTLEAQPYCLELTSKGWRVTSLRHDCMNGDMRSMDLHTRYFETVYALLDQISLGYRQRFSEALAEKLNQLQGTSTLPYSSSLGSLVDRMHANRGSVPPYAGHLSPRRNVHGLDLDEALEELTLGSISPTFYHRPSLPTLEKSEAKYYQGLLAPAPPSVTVRHPSGEGKTQHFPSSPGGLA